MTTQNQAAIKNRANQPKSLWPSRVLTLGLAAWTALIVVWLLAAFVYNTPGHDQNWFLCAAQRVLSGAKFGGAQLVECNPPLIIWFSTIPVFLSQYLHLAPDRVLQLLVFILICASVAWGVRVLRIAGWARNPVSTYLLLCALVTAETWLNSYDLAQREHLVLILILPYILSAASGAAMKLTFSELCALGVACGLAVCFKPQQILVLVALEVFLAAGNRSLHRLLSPDFLCAVAVVIAYIESISLFASLYFKLMPILLAAYASYAGATVWAVIKVSQGFLFLFVQIWIVFMLQRRRMRFAAVSGAVLTCSFAAAVAYWVQRTGWRYQTVPMIALLVLAALLILIDLPPAFTDLIGDWRLNRTFAVTTLILLSVLLPVQLRLHRQAERLASAHPFYPYTVLAQYPSHSPVYVFSINVSDSFPAVSHDHLVWASRFPVLWMLPAIVENESNEAGGPPPFRRLPPNVVQQLAGLQHAETTEDFRRWKPVVVIDKKCPQSVYCQGLGKYNFDPLPWFLQDPAFAAEWSHYHLKEVHGIYSVYIRTN